MSPLDNLEPSGPRVGTALFKLVAIGSVRDDPAAALQAVLRNWEGPPADALRGPDRWWQGWSPGPKGSRTRTSLRQMPGGSALGSSLRSATVWHVDGPGGPDDDADVSSAQQALHSERARRAGREAPVLSGLVCPPAARQSAFSRARL